MRVFIPPPLRSYTGGRAWLEVEGVTLGAVLEALDARYPGLRFRVVDEQDQIRPHIRFVVREEFAHALTHPLEPGDEIRIICALSGGSPDRGAEDCRSIGGESTPVSPRAPAPPSSLVMQGSASPSPASLA